MQSSVQRTERRVQGARWPLLLPVLGLLTCLLAFALRAHRLGELSLWYDEGWSVHLGRLAPWQALPEIMSSGHTHPPLYYLLLGAWQSVAGPSEFSMRFPSLAFGVLTVILGYRLGREISGAPSSTSLGQRSEVLVGQCSGLLAALFLAVAPPQIVYSQEARSYTLFALEYGLLILLTCRFVRRPARFGTGEWAALVMVEAASLYTHYFALILLAYLGLVMLGACLRAGGWSWNEQWRMGFGAVPAVRWLTAQLLVGLLYVPWVWTAVRQLGEHAPPDMRPLSLRPFLGLMWRFHFSGLSWAAANYAPLAQATTALALLGAASLVASVLLRRAAGWDWLLLACFLMPLASVFGIERMRPGIHPRYTLMLSAPLLLLFARQVVLWLRRPGLERLPGVALGIAILLPLTLGLQAMIREHDKDDVRGLATYLTHEATAQDLIVFDYEDFAFQYYYRGSAPVLYLEAHGPAGALVEQVLEKAQGQERAFLVTWYTGQTDRRGLYPFLLEFNGDLELDRQFRGLRLRQYALEPRLGAPGLTATFADFGLFQLTAASWEQSVSTDGAIAVALRWRLTDTTTLRYKATVILRDSVGRQVWSVDAPLVNDEGRPTEEWLAGTEVENYSVVPIPLGSPPVAHALHVSLYTEEALEGETGAPLDLLSETGAPAGQLLTVGKVVLTPSTIPQRDPYRTRAQMALQPVGEQAAPGLVLEGARTPPLVVQRGARLPVILLWHAIEGALPDYQISLQLVGTSPSAGGQILAQQRGSPADGSYPTSAWHEGEWLLDRRELLIDPQGPVGQARLEVQVSEGAPLILGQVAVEAVKRVFQLPPAQHTTYARFGEVAELVGYDLPVTVASARREVPLTLYWRAINEGPLPTSYSVFTHMLTEGMDRLVAQHDGPPDEGRHPTTAWVQGEVVLDAHLLRWREEYSGTCPIEVGMYDPATDQRLPVHDGSGSRLPDDRFVLDQLVHSLPERTDR
jgi:hypothetical protein